MKLGSLKEKRTQELILTEKMGKCITLRLFVWYHYLFFQFACAGNNDESCRETRCSDNGPVIRYPFRLKQRQPQQQNCGVDGFDLSCDEISNDTVVELPVTVKLSVLDIDYDSMLIGVTCPGGSGDGCFLRPQLSKLNVSASSVYRYPWSPYFDDGFYPETCPVAFFNCSSKQQQQEMDRQSQPYYYRRGCALPPISYRGNLIHAVIADCSVDYNLQLLRSCPKIYEVPEVSSEMLFNEFNNFTLSWSESICPNCSAQGKDYCRWSNQYQNSTECYTPSVSAPISISHRNNGAIAGEVLGSFLLVLGLIALYHVITSKKRKREDQLKIEKFLEDYIAIKPTRYDYADIKKITDQFKDELGQGAFGTVYKGKLSDDVFVAVKVLNTSPKGNGEEFINEVGTIGRVHHVNVVRLVGYCADGFRRALIYEFMPNNSLEKFISPENHHNRLSWETLNHIAMGVAKGIEYLHQGCDQRILHFDIKPRNVLLDDNFNPKISDFGQAKLCSKEQSAVSMTAARGTMGYIAPEVFSRNFGDVSYKSDVYSFGMLLLEMVGGRRNNSNGSTAGNDHNQVYFPEWVYNRLDKGEELEIEVEKEDDIKIAEKLTVVGLWCIQWYPVDRPSMKVVIQMLEGEEDSNLVLPPNPFGSTNPTSRVATRAGRRFDNQLEVITE